MATTIREQIITAFALRSQPLSNSDVERVRRAKPANTERNISIWDGEDIAEEKAFGIQKLNFPIALNIQWEPDINPSTSANALIGEVIQLMIGIDSNYLGLADKVDYISATPEYPADGSGYVSLTVIFNISYSTKIGDPFTAVN